MKIVSSLLPPDSSNVVLMVLDAVVDARSVFVGLGQGELRDGEPFITPVAQACLARLLEHSRQQAETGSVHMVEIKHFHGLPERVCEAMAAAQQGDAVFFVCANGRIYDAVFEQLHVQMAPDYTAKH